jgi:crossover junction endodeoxyribonuclease RusA
MSTRIRFLLPLPPSINNQYRDADIGGVSRRVLSAEAKHWKHSISKAFHTLLVNGRLPDELMDDAQNGYIALYGEFFFETPHRRDLDGGLKIAQDAVCAGLRVNDNRVVEIRLLKRVDKENPRLELTVQVVTNWEFEARTSLFCERLECDKELDLLRAVKPFEKVAPDERASTLNGFGDKSSTRNTRKSSDLEDLMNRFGWK